MTTSKIRNTIAAAAVAISLGAVPQAAHAEQSLSEFLADFVLRTKPPAAAPATTCADFFTAARLNTALGNSPIYGKLLEMKVFEVMETKQTGTNNRQGIKCEVNVFTSSGEMKMFAETKMINSSLYWEVSPIDPALFE